MAHSSQRDVARTEPTDISETGPLLVGDTENDALLSVIKKDDFHQKRWRCLDRPENAAETLGPWGVLELEIVGGKDLVASDVGMFVATSNACVKVFLDDKRVSVTSAKRSLNPEWNAQSKVHVTTPKSMVRLQVADAKESADDKGNTGFVEFCLGDIPFDKCIEGFLELRLHENLQKTSVIRYAEHCKKNDHDRGVQHEKDVDEKSRQISIERAGSTASVASSNSARSQGKFMSLLTEESFTRFRRKKVPTKCAGCYGASTGDSRSEQNFNGGYLFVRMTLKLLGTKLDYFLSLALHGPTAKNFGVKALDDKKTDLSVQELYDVSQEFKYLVWEDAYVPIFNYLSYICMWRSFFLSFPLTVCWVAMCLQTWLFSVVFPGTICLGMLLNSITSVRQAMTVSGVNAPLTQQGLSDVAKKKSRYDLERFVQRIITSFEGKVTNQDMLRSVAVRCCRDGEPMITFDVLKTQLKQAKWIELDKRDFSPGTLVLVDERHRAKVKHVKGHSQDSKVTVEYDQPPEDGKEEDELVRGRVVKREVLDRTDWKANIADLTMSKLPAQADSQIRNVQSKAVKALNSIAPVVNKIAAILTWRDKFRAFAIVVASGLCSAGGCFMFYQEMFGGHEEGVKGTNPILTLVVSELDNIAMLILILLFMLPNARWFITTSALFRAFYRYFCGMPRKAPQTWAFFKKEQWKQTLSA